MGHGPGATLIDRLQDPALYTHPVRRFLVIETHISWVILTGQYAYKIKKPVNLGFVDFSTLDKRLHYCQEELRLNQRLAPELYLAVIPITGSTSQPALAGKGRVIEYAVKMREFAQSAILDKALARGDVRGDHIVGLARAVAEFHNSAAVATTDSPFGNAASVWQPACQNFDQIHTHLDTIADLDLLSEIKTWSAQTHTRLGATWEERKHEGFIRECHGDMHLGNMALIDDKIRIFDCLEFNESLRWIDVMSEVAFVTMDLYDRGRPGLAHRFLNDYLQHTGDYSGLRILRFYQVYRALVRAKVACLRLSQPGLSAEERIEIHGHYRQYLRLARHYTHLPPTPLIITHGLSASGKTTVSDTLLECSGAIRIRSDVERKRLFGLAPEARSGSGLATDLYSPEANIQTYKRLADLSRNVITSGFPVIVDAAFLSRQQRRQFHQLADDLQVPFVIFHCDAPTALLRRRIRVRQTQDRDPSEATLQVLNHQINTQDPLQPDEAEHIFTVKAEESP